MSDHYADLLEDRSHQAIYQAEKEEQLEEQLELNITFFKENKHDAITKRNTINKATS